MKGRQTTDGGDPRGEADQQAGELTTADLALVRRVRNQIAHSRGDAAWLAADIVRSKGDISWTGVETALRLTRDLGVRGASPALADLCARIAVGRGAQRILDPSASSPTLIGTVSERIPRAHAVALMPNDSLRRIGEALDPEVDWREDMPLEDLENDFDLIVATPPMGEKGGERANSLLVEASDLVAGDGALAFLVPDGFFFRADGRRTREALGQNGFRVEAAISVEGGLPGSNVSVSLILVTRGEAVERLFIGRLDSGTDRGKLVKNMLAHRGGEYLQLGVLYPSERYLGWRSLINETSLLEGLKGARGRIRELGEVATEFTRLPAAEEGPGNSIFMPNFPRSRVHTEPPTNPKGYARIDLDPSEVNARWMASWFNEPLGRASRLALAAGVVERVAFSNLPRLIVVLPPVEEQSRTISVVQELDLVASEVSKAKDRLWAQSVSVESASELLGRVRVALQDEHGDLDAPPTLAEWIEHLPYPLAGVGRRYLAVRSTREKVDRLQHFFEAYAILMTTILLSAARRDSPTYEDTVAKLKRAGGDRRSVLEIADFSTWITMGRTIAKRVRKRIDGDKSQEAISVLFGRLPEPFVEQLLKGAFWERLDDARRVRNERGHGGAEGERWRLSKLARLDAALNDLRLLAPRAFAGIDLIRPGGSEQGFDDLFTFSRAERLMGSNATFEERELKSTGSMRGGALYLVPSDAVVEKPLLLAPLIQMSRAPEVDESAVYYYNRRLPAADGPGFKFVSYNFENQPEERFDDEGLSEIIADLTPDREE